MEKQIGLTYDQFNARRKAEQAIAADEWDLQALNAVAENIVSSHTSRNTVIRNGKTENGSFGSTY